MNRSCSVVSQSTSCVVVRLLPEPRHQRPQQQLLREAHPRVRRHLERAELDQPQPAGRRVGRVQLVDAELGAVRVARDVDQQMAEHAIDQPRRAVLPCGNCSNAISSSYVASRRPSSTRGAWLVGPMNMPENKYDSDG